MKQRRKMLKRAKNNLELRFYCKVLLKRNSNNEIPNSKEIKTRKCMSE